jgi:hypothetical protein
MQEFEYIGLIIVFGLVYIIVIIAMAVTGFSIFRSRKLHRARDIIVDYLDKQRETTMSFGSIQKEYPYYNDKLLRDVLEYFPNDLYRVHGHRLARVTKEEPLQGSGPTGPGRVTTLQESGSEDSSTGTEEKEAGTDTETPRPPLTL